MSTLPFAFAPLLLATLLVPSTAWARSSRVDICHWNTTTQMFTVTTVATTAVPAHFSHGDSYPATYWADLDGDSYGDPFGATDVCPNFGYEADNTDCDDTDATINPGAPEADNGIDDDCDPWIDEDFVAEGDIILTEIVRNPRFGNASAVVDGQWFEVYNTSERDVDLSNWYVIRSVNGISDAYFVDPLDEVVVPAGDYAVFCRTDDYEDALGVTDPLLCDYTWGDPTRGPTYSSDYHDNTFYLLRDHDRLGLYIEGGSLYGRLIDDVHWSWVLGATNNWPRDASYSTSLNHDMFDGWSNDEPANWCSTGLGTPTTDYTWWTSLLAHEHGTPGADNAPCN